MYTSSDNAARMDTTNKLRSKAATIGGSSAEDIPKNVAPPAQNKKSGLMLRVVSSVTLISFMCLTYAMGHLYYALFLLWCSFKCYFELIKINKIERKEAKIYLQSALEWYGPIGFCFYLTPYTLIRRVLVDNDSLNDFKNDHSLIYNIMFTHHSMICAMLLIFGLVLFTLSLEKGAYRYQFKRLGWQIVCTMVPISGGLFFGYYVFKGYFWVVLTNGSVMCNDIISFVFGKTMGRTKLIALSPNKTVEGFVGGGISTVIFAIWVSG
jgi:phosphatidate cytidylyltransferase